MYRALIFKVQVIFKARVIFRAQWIYKALIFNRSGFTGRD